MTRRLTCDVPNCGRSRRRWQRLCSTCWAKLPGELRVGLEEAHHQRRFADWTSLKKRAAAFLGTDRDAGRPALPAEQVYAATARRMGERD